MTSAPQPDCIQSAIPTLAGALTGPEAGTLSAREILEDCLAHIAARDDVLHAFAHLDAAAASRWAVKDNFDAAGLPATANSRLRAGRIATQDAALVTALRNTGAVLLGKLATWEFSTSTNDSHAREPRWTARAGAVQRLLARGPTAAMACNGAAGWGGGVAVPRHGLRGGHALAPAAAGVTAPRFAARAAELAAAMLQAGARLPRDWPKELWPANPAAEDDDKTGKQKNG